MSASFNDNSKVDNAMNFKVPTNGLSLVYVYQQLLLYKTSQLLHELVSISGGGLISVLRKNNSANRNLNGFWLVEKFAVSHPIPQSLN